MDFGSVYGNPGIALIWLLLSLVLLVFLVSLTVTEFLLVRAMLLVYLMVVES